MGLMNNQFKISKIAIQNGWLDMIIQDVDKETVITASYLTDAIYDFTIAVVLLCEGSKERSFVWMNEPGEVQWTISRNNLEVSISIIYSVYNERTMTFDKEILYQGNVSQIRLARAVLRALNQLDLDYPGSMYQLALHKNYAFPDKLVHRLSESIKSL